MNDKTLHTTINIWIVAALIWTLPNLDSPMREIVLSYLIILGFWLYGVYVNPVVHFTKPAFVVCLTFILPVFMMINLFLTALGLKI